jgi:hypothetical protein
MHGGGEWGVESGWDPKLIARKTDRKLVGPPNGSLRNCTRFGSIPNLENIKMIMQCI